MRNNMPRFLATYLFTLLLSALTAACSKNYTYKENAMPEAVALSPKLKTLFKTTKLICFGRYAMKVPSEAHVIWGSSSFPSKIHIFRGSPDSINDKVTKDIKKLKFDSDEALITFNDRGPVQNSWQIRYFEDNAAKELNLHFFNTYISKGDYIFLLGSAVEKGESEEQTVMREALRAKSLRLRTEDEFPSEEGYCIDHGFIASSFYGDQEMVNIGVYLPSLPDITFSISSNKDAYADYPKEEFEKKKVDELSLLARIRQAQQEQGLTYPHRTVLREGKRNVQHWHGDESLIKRSGGIHDFEWGFVGTPKNVASPSEIIVNMYTKVEHNVVGAAQTTSVSDDEAVALWDELLSGLKFRIKVPGAPEGSYYKPFRDVNTSP